ncbi:hypothetical protein BgAZ_304590 [Babesia gibsoni]|uniref:Uncharacterized protein n=1 Tax=Babesia gibsoni TaxID=33632 RepID=A0AAD8LPP3_BABGI|nr:hypothetical protein BgAZ_304590 [Babesia gibsoni]
MVADVKTDVAEYYDPEKNATGDHYCFSETTPTYIRHDFIKKVFAIVGLQLLATFGFVTLCCTVESVKIFMMEHPALMYTAAAIQGVACLLVFFMPSLVDRKGGAVTFTVVMTTCMSIVVAYVASTYAPFELAVACGITLGVTLSLIIFAFQTKWDFTSFIWYIFPIMIAMMISSVLLAIFPNKTAGIVYACIGAIIFSIVLVLDIQLVVGGKKYEWTIDDYVLAALCIYVDIINLFLHVLRLVGAFGD